jgi:hypothetical protein
VAANAIYFPYINVPPDPWLLRAADNAVKRRPLAYVALARQQLPAFHRGGFGAAGPKGR